MKGISASLLIKKTFKDYYNLAMLGIGSKAYYLITPCNRDVNETLNDETETFKKHVSRRPRRSHHKTETFKLIVYICNFWNIIWYV